MKIVDSLHFLLVPHSFSEDVPWFSTSKPLEIPVEIPPKSSFINFVPVISRYFPSDFQVISRKFSVTIYNWRFSKPPRQALYGVHGNSPSMGGAPARPPTGDGVYVSIWDDICICRYIIWFDIIYDIIIYGIIIYDIIIYIYTYMYVWLYIY